MMIDLCGVRLRNPLVLASGIWGSCAGTLVRVGRAGAGAVTAKSCSLEPRSGHPNPTVLDWGGGLINAVGLANPGADAQAEMLRTARAGLAPQGVPLIASVFGHTRHEFVEAVRRIVSADPDLIELNISCPNVEAEFGRPFALDAMAAAGVTEAVRAVYAGPLLVKLSPNAPDIASVARAVAAAGASGITAVNTLGPGMVIDVRARRPILSNRVGGISGPAMLPVAVRCVYDIAAAVDLPILGTGGVTTGEDALQMIMAGATAVGIGSALYREGPAAFGRILHELETLMQGEGYASLDAVRGCAHG
ncbi:MAG TPA: dihydroorotate dehydrogenase [Chloroflexi bacterium]|jgi:dihydroorotate dehydrogenase (NAD+) catalytic subunit|nr:dihydroorotate dehydrogenase [Chloroflexota bacterium]